MRDQRLDFFRGLALFFIFIDHVPNNLYSSFTLHAAAFFDAAEIFVFISGYTVALVFGRTFLSGDAVFGAAQVLRRCWTLYVAHVFLLVGFIAQVSWTAHRFNNAMFTEEMGVAHFLEEPHVALVEGLLLRFQPNFLDILPLYIVLLLAFVPFALLFRVSVRSALALSLLIYLAVPVFGLRLRTYPDGTWFFNPFAWQLLFNIGAAIALMGLRKERLLPRSRAWLWLAVGFAAVALLVKLSWVLASFHLPVRPVLLRTLGPLTDKTDLDVLRLLQFLAVALIVSWLVSPDARWLRSAAARPIILCGENSLHIVCLWIFLAFLVHFVLVQIAASPFAQTLVVLAGITVMCAVAYLMTWFKERSGRRPRPDSQASPQAIRS